MIKPQAANVVEFKSIASVRPRRMADDIFEQILGQILEGEWKPGDRMPSESRLAEEFGVSVHTLRQALRRLEEAELIRMSHGAFGVVLDPNASNDIRVATWRYSHTPTGTRHRREIMETGAALTLTLLTLAARRCKKIGFGSLRDLVNAYQADEDTDKSQGRFRAQFWMELARLSEVPLADNVCRWYFNAFLNHFPEINERRHVPKDLLILTLNELLGLLEKGDAAAALQFWSERVLNFFEIMSVPEGPSEA
jgi:DNA-binding FadR family transcriptional regulator